MPNHHEFAPAKINLALHITAKNAQGYHQLESLIVFAKIGDRIKISSNDTNKTDILKINGSFSFDLNSENKNENLILQALKFFRKNWPNTLPKTLKIELEKNLPIASGIGGGSADCAATLRLLNKISGNQIPIHELEKLALGLGADVPMCLKSKPAIVSNIGEIIEPLKTFPNAYVTLINPKISISTKQVFSLLKNPNNTGLPKISNEYLDGFENLEHLTKWLKSTRNDLLPAAISLAPTIKQIIYEFKNTQNCLFTSMSGSGATVFGLFASLKDAEKATFLMNRKWPHFWIKHAPLLSNHSETII